MALTSSSTVPEIEAQYRDNCDWDDTGSVAKAKLCRQAIRYIRRTPASGSAEGVSWTDHDFGAELAALNAFLASATQSNGPRATRLRPSPRFRG